MLQFPMFTPTLALIAGALFIVIIFLLCCCQTDEKEHIDESKLRPSPTRADIAAEKPKPESERTTFRPRYMDEHERAEKPIPERKSVREVLKDESDRREPEPVDKVMFERLVDRMTSSAFTFEIEGMSIPEVHEKTIHVLTEAGFYIVSDELDIDVERAEARVNGWARYSQTSNAVGVRISFRGEPDRKRMFCHMTVSGDERSMVLPTISEIRKKILA